MCAHGGGGGGGGGGSGAHPAINGNTGKLSDYLIEIYVNVIRCESEYKWLIVVGALVVF